MKTIVLLLAAALSVFPAAMPADAEVSGSYTFVLDTGIGLTTGVATFDPVTRRVTIGRASFEYSAFDAAVVIEIRSGVSLWGRTILNDDVILFYNQFPFPTQTAGVAYRASAALTQ